ncbi:hypothetical protein MMC17_001930 [Xylographa soralifera]|nr:hypothetical protein [Xylographa soralifera]
MAYLNSKIQKWMPQKQRVAVDSSPTLHDIFDTINSTFATLDPRTTLPLEFYDPILLSFIDRITVDEEFAGYKSSLEYRTLGIGHLLGEVVSRMTDYARREAPKDTAKIALFGGHDSTIAAILASLGTMEGDNGTWPGYGSSVVVELFEGTNLGPRSTCSKGDMQSLKDRSEPRSIETSEIINRRTISGPWDGFYVRLKYNDRSVDIPGCQGPGLHLAGNPTFCTLAAFKDIIDLFTPPDWKQACISNLDKPPFPTKDESIES